MKSNRFLILPTLLFTFLLLSIHFPAANVWGKPGIRQGFFDAYPSAVGSVIETVPSNEHHCGVCHYSFDGGGERNPHGNEIQAAIKNFPNTAEGLRDAAWSIRNNDPEADGYSTLEEVNDPSGLYSNNPTFPGLLVSNVNKTKNVSIAEIQDYLVPVMGGDTTPPNVTVYAPNGNETLTANSSTLIQWSATDAGGVAAIEIYLSDDGGLTYLPIALGLPATSSYTWIPANRPTTQAKILVKAVDTSLNPGQDASNEVFTIQSPVSSSNVPSTLRDFDMPGTQPLEGGAPLENPANCGVCHGNYNPTTEPYDNWRGSMMAQASIDPIFKANLVIANQDAPESGDLCVRCHFSRGWLDGRSVPTTGSQIVHDDKTGVSCELCHRMVDPISDPANPPEDIPILAALRDPPGTFTTGSFVIDPDGRRRGPFTDATSGHSILASPFHREAAFCGTCHDVSNPAFEKDGQGNYNPNVFDSPATNFASTHLVPVERTYSEWLNSAYNSPTGIYAPQFGGNKAFVSTCQDCHLRDVTGFGADPVSFPDVPNRPDLPLHDMTGGSTWVPTLLSSIAPDDVNEPALQAGIVRSRYILQNAADLSYQIADNKLNVTVINNTGHKLPTGYPEGRRVWLNVKFYDASNILLSESGVYDTNTGILTHDSELKIYDVEPGMDPNVAALTENSSGPSFHFVLNNKIYKDNRIPPRGFTNAAYAEFGGSPVEYSYADGQYWDTTSYTLPSGAASATVTLYYQSTSKEFVEFLRDENVTNSEGLAIYDLWNDNGKCPPEVMGILTYPQNDLNQADGVDLVDFAIFASWWQKDCPDGSCGGANLDNSDNLVDLNDLVIFMDAWLWGK